MKKTDLDHVVRRYPYPIAEVVRLYLNIREGDYAARVIRLKELFEVVGKILSAIALRIYLFEGRSDPEIKRMIPGLKNPSIGHWIGLLRQIVNSYGDVDEGENPILSSVINFYNGKIPDGRSGEVYRAAETILGFLSKDGSGKLPKTDNAALFDLWTTIRNHLGSGGHGSAYSDIEMKTIVESLETMIFHLLAELRFLESIGFHWIDEVRTERGITRYTTDSLSGSHINRATCVTNAEIGDQQLMDKELYVCVGSVDDDGHYEIRHAISITPLVIVHACNGCKTKQVFFFNGQKGKTLQYLSYQCGHQYFPPDLKSDLQDIQRLIQGELSARSLFKDRAIGLKAPGESKVSSIQDRAIARNRAEEGLQLVRNYTPDLALSYAAEALKYDQDSSLALYAQGLAFLSLTELEAAGDSLETAAQLDPNNVSIAMARAVVAMEAEDSSTAQEALKNALRLDPSSVRAQKLLRDAPNYSSRIHSATTHEQRQSAAISLVNSLFKEHDVEDLHVRGWMFDYPPWSWIERTSLHPLIGSLLFAAVVFLSMALSNLARLDATFLLKFTVVSGLCFMGAYCPFLFSRVLEKYYDRLRGVIALPSEAFKRWYLSEISIFWGVTNLRSSLSNDSREAVQDDSEDGELNEGNAKTKIENFTQRIREDREILWSFLVIVIILIPFQLACINDPFRWTVGHVVHYFVGFLEAWVCAWAIQFTLRNFFMIFRLIRQPLRYFISMPYSLSIAVIGKMYIFFGFCGFFSLIFFLGQHLAYRTHQYAPVASVLFVTGIGVVLAIQAIVPQFTIILALRNLREKKIAQFSVPLEDLSNRFVQEPTKKEHEQLLEKADYLAFLKRSLPLMRLMKPNAIAILLALIEVALIAGYIYIITATDWFV